MTELIKFFMTIFTSISIFFSATFFPAEIKPETENFDFTYLQYPEEAVFSLEKAGVSVEDFKARVDADLPEYVQSGGYDDVNGIFISPYYSAKIGDKEIPVYASMVFNRADDTGDIHSFSEIYVDTNEEFCFTISLTGTSFELKNAIVLPEKHGVGTECKNGTARASITKPGIYTFLVNGAQQHYGFTLFAREKFDEEKEIAEYIEQYGKENVIICDPGVHNFDYLNYVGMENKVLYLKQGAYLMANHRYDIMSAEDENLYFEESAPSDNAIGLTRYPFVNFYRCKNIKITGKGVIDMTRLDRRERRGMVFTDCENISLDGIKIINSPEWSLISYCCKNIDIKDVDILGHRGNCDGFAICNSHNVTVDNCFARVADDTFEVKALGGKMDSNNITFTNCIAWGGYARCFGITGEVCKKISNVTFRDCAVVYRDAVWDNNRIGSLVVVAEICEGSIDGIVFENIEIFRDEGRPILVKIYDEEAENFEIKNVVYKNISYTSYMTPKIDGTDSNANTLQVTLENITSNNKKISKPGLRFEVGRNSDVTFR
ncbi:MAG: hypothetical protein E7536_00835 [Ruminococcaceae bacterium]|nr:hypothetical protein [Oscillospiraceae bacterium]